MTDTQAAGVTATEPLASGVVQVTIAFDRPFAFAPGQYVSIRFPDGVTRAYCISSAPQRPQAVQLCVRLGAGAGSSAVRELRVGDRIEVEGPLGEFVLPEDDSRDVVFLAGDTGLAPIRSIVLHLRAVEDRRRITVLYEPTDGQIVYGADFGNMAAAGSIRYLRGPIEDLVRGEKELLTRSAIMVAGFDRFLERALAILEAEGIERTRVIAESFGRL
ncbi:MAG TPA: FAD-binding oxidoreductase [Thermoanaerobaculia bacterium]|nr:FAD-binding oxidoreductase [Thermoanaerobaculia bacterium]